MGRPQRLVLTFAALVIAAEVILALVASERQWVAPTALFWLVVTAASLCVVTSLALMAVARRNEQPEIGFVALFFLAVSVLPLAHGLTTPGILYGPNTATAASVFWAVPIGMAALAPSLFRSRQIGRWIARRWHLWASAWGLAIFSLAAAMLSWPDLVPVPDMGSATAIGVAAVSAAVCVVAAWRHARLAQIAQRTGPLVVAFGYLIVGTSALVFIAGPPYATHFWFAHAFDIGGVFLATIGGVVVYARSGSVRTILAPVVAYDPHSALEVGLSPVVRKFVADLQLKDRLTRDHVVRCGGHAIDLAVDVGLSPAEVREAGLVGLLHDVGKLEIPDEILKKPGQLTPSEFAVMQTHTTRGHRLLSRTPGLEWLASGVRSHHERVDGRGYPHGLEGEEIPVVARLVAVCDAYDAMTIDRPYRSGMAAERARAILRDHAGSQWDTQFVDALIALSSQGRLVTASPLDTVGLEGERAHQPIGCGCLPELVEVA